MPVPAIRSADNRDPLAQGEFRTKMAVCSSRGDRGLRLVARRRSPVRALHHHDRRYPVQSFPDWLNDCFNGCLKVTMKPETCVDCGATPPHADTSYTAIGQGWRV